MNETNEANLRLQELRRLQRQDRQRRQESSLRRTVLIATGAQYPDLVFPCPTCGESLEVTAQYTGFEAFCCRCGNPLLIPDCEDDQLGTERFGREVQHRDSLGSAASYRLDASYLANVKLPDPNDTRRSGRGSDAADDLEIIAPDEERVRRSEHNVVLSIVVNRDGEVSSISQPNQAQSPESANGKETPAFTGRTRRGSQRAIKTPVKSTLELAITSDGGREVSPSLTVWQTQSEQREWERLIAYGLLGLLLLVVTAVCVFLFINGGGNQLGVTAPSTGPAVTESPEGTQQVREMPINAVAPADLEETKWVVRHYLTTPTWRERLDYVRMPERVAPLMEEYYKIHPDGVINLSSMDMTWAGYVRGHFLIVVTVVDSSYKEHYFTLERINDEYKIDWEVLVEYNPMSWKEFRETRPTEPIVFRVSLTADQYYNFKFADSAKYQCFRLASREEFVGLYGYADRSVEWFKNIDLAPGFTRLAMVKLRYPEDAQGSNQVEITDYVRQSWVVFPEDLDESVPAPEDVNSTGAPGTPVQAEGLEVKSQPTRVAPGAAPTPAATGAPSAPAPPLPGAPATPPQSTPPAPDPTPPPPITEPGKNARN